MMDVTISKYHHIVIWLVLCAFFYIINPLYISNIPLRLICLGEKIEKKWSFGMLHYAKSALGIRH